MRPIVFSALLSMLSVGAYSALTWRPPAVGLGLTSVPAGVATAAGGVAVPASERVSAPVRPPVQTRLSTEEYPVYGTTEAELLRSLLDQGPRADGNAFFGLTTTETDLHYRTAETADGCALTDVAVDLDVTVTLPDWTPPPAAPPALRRDWDRFIRALRRHEDEHRHIAVQSAEALQQAVAGVRGPTCPAAEAAGRRRVARLQIEATAAHRRLDGETGHGRTQGAVWPAVRP